MPTVLSSREVRALLAAPKDQIGALSGTRDHSAGGRNRYFCAVRDNVILELLFSTGIRIGELVALNVSDVGMENSQIHIIGRATRGRTVTITSHVVIESLMNYLEMRSERNLNTDALFVGRSGTPGGSRVEVIGLSPRPTAAVRPQPRLIVTVFTSV